MAEQLQPLSNSLDDFIAGGLYPGGTGIVKEFCFKLWDYDGKQPPNSSTFVFMRLAPIDGSNDGKDLEHYWSVGSADEFQPDHTGGFLVAVTRPGKEPRKGISNQCNWHQALASLVRNCGMDPGKFNGPGGLRQFEGSEATVSRVDQVARDFQDANAAAAPALATAPGQTAPQQQQRRSNKPTTLVFTRVKYAWDKAGAPAAAGTTATAPTGKAAAVARARAQAAPAASPVAETPAAAAAAPAASNGHAAATGNALVDILSTLLADPQYANGIEFSEIGKLVTERMTLAGVPGKQRAVLLKSIQDGDALATLAAQQGWSYEAGSLFIPD